MFSLTKSTVDVCTNSPSKQHVYLSDKYRVKPAPGRSSCPALGTRREQYDKPRLRGVLGLLNYLKNDPCAGGRRKLRVTNRNDKCLRKTDSRVRIPKHPHYKIHTEPMRPQNAMAAWTRRSTVREMDTLPVGSRAKVGRGTSPSLSEVRFQTSLYVKDAKGIKKTPMDTVGQRRWDSLGPVGPATHSLSRS